MKTESLFDLTGKVAVVTGGGDGIGKGCCEILAHTPIKRLGEVSDIAGAVLYFAAPVSAWVSGKVLMINGGRADAWLTNVGEIKFRQREPKKQRTIPF